MAVMAGVWDIAAAQKEGWVEPNRTCAALIYAIAKGELLVDPCGLPIVFEESDGELTVLASWKMCESCGSPAKEQYP